MKSSVFIILLFVLISSPGVSQLNLNLGMTSYNEENYSEAIYWLNKSLDSGTEDVYKALTIRGLAKSKSGDFKGADKDLFEALRLNPRNTYSFYNLSLCFVDQKKYSRALTFIDSAIAMSEPKCYLYTQRALIYGMMADYKKAINDGTKALELSPNDFDSNENMGWIYFLLKEYDIALKYYSKSLSINADHYKGLLNRAQCYTEMQLYDSAITDLDHAVRKYPLAPLPVAQKGEIRYKQKKYNEACNNFEDLRKLSPIMGTTYIEQYCNDREIISYYDNGQMKEKCTYRDGYKNGRHLAWYENGKPQLEGEYASGQHNGKYTEYYENGNINKTGNMADDLPEGVWLHYYESGKLNSRGYLSAGQQDGEWFLYYENGTLKAQGDLCLGVKTGLFIENYESGKLKAYYHYKNDVTEGDYKLFYENGHLKQQGTLVDGKEYDTPQRWDEKGHEITD